MLGDQDLLDAGTEQRPGGLRKSEMATEIEQSALADASAGAKGTDEAMGEIGFAVGGRAGLSAADEHGMSKGTGRETGGQ